jgi:hypothetical protein
MPHSPGSTRRLVGARHGACEGVRHSRPWLGGYAGHMTAPEVAQRALVNRDLETRWEAFDYSAFSSLVARRETAPSHETVSGSGAVAAG